MIFRIKVVTNKLRKPPARITFNRSLYPNLIIQGRKTPLHRI